MQTIDPDRPEWASRLLKIRETAVIVGENPATVYRKIDAGIYGRLEKVSIAPECPSWVMSCPSP